MVFDLVVIGAGIAGSSLAARIAANGAKVLLVERDEQFTDRIRGEALQPWGVAEARKLGVAQVLRQNATELRYFDQILNAAGAMRRDLASTTTCGEAIWGFYHPDVQERLLQHAAKAGAEVRRGACVERIVPGSMPRVRIGTSEVEARLVALCAGRNPGLRSELGFQVQRSTISFLLSGVWLQNLPAEVDHTVAYVANHMGTGAVAALFPQPGDRARAYFGFHAESCARLQGHGDFARFREMFRATAGDAIPFGDAQPAGPLASFECKDVWVEEPYRDGVALLGDAACSTDPSWGQGLSIALRDARVLSDELIGTADWNAAARRYACRHDEDSGKVRTVTGWFYDMFQRVGPEADACRGRALPLIAQDPTRVPDVLFSGPDLPLTANARARFFGEDSQMATAQS